MIDWYFTMNATMEKTTGTPQLVNRITIRIINGGRLLQFTGKGCDSLLDLINLRPDLFLNVDVSDSSRIALTLSRGSGMFSLNPSSTVPIEAKRTSRRIEPGVGSALSELALSQFDISVSRDDQGEFRFEQIGPIYTRNATAHSGKWVAPRESRLSKAQIDRYFQQKEEQEETIRKIKRMGRSRDEDTGR
jgi:hypothetical protein